MAYTKTNWTDTTPINTTNLNKIENGIAANDIAIGNLSNLNTSSKDNLVTAINSIVESGVNDNGSWIKFADGTMICTKIVSGNTGNVLNLWYNGIYFMDIQNGNWAQEFVELYNTQATNQNLQLWCTIGNVTTTSAGTTRIIRPDDGGNKGQNYSISLLAIGKWK